MATTPHDPPLNPYLVIFVGVFAVSFGSIFVRLANAPAIMIATYRVGIASLLLWPVGLWKEKPALQKISRRDLALALLTGCFLALHFATWVSSLDYTSVASSVVLVNTNPLWVGMVAPLLTGERVSRIMAVGILISVIGGVIIGIGDFGLAPAQAFGDLLALAGAIMAGLYILMGRNLRRRLPALTYVIVVYSAAALVLALLALLTRQPLHGFSQETWILFFLMALIPQIMGHSSYNWALGYLSASFVAVSLLGEPIAATIMAYFLFGEGLTPAKLAGGLMILMGIYVTAKEEAKNG
ncbi:MAG: DMT family transporter [Chloroflexi bacterium]|nr:DMT family transporter [Chloroflexota bacterium]